MDLQGVELGGMDWTDPVQFGDSWQAVVNCIMNLRVSHNAGNLQLFTVGIKTVCMACRVVSVVDLCNWLLLYKCSKQTKGNVVIPTQLIMNVDRQAGRQLSV
jgi:hypothetical protein